jgi:hypothetical protein
MAKIKPHKKTIIYIVPVGRQNIPTEVVECDCIETKGVDHVAAGYKREAPQSPGGAL